jgi:hypothetical protein
MNEHDWGLAEQNAFERMQEYYEGLPLDDFLEWLDKLKKW